MKKMIKYLLSLLFIALVIYACVDDLKESDPDGQLEEAARSWYQENTVTSKLKTAQEGTDVQYMPEWELYFTAGNKEYDVVETSIATEGRFTLMHPDVIDRYKATKDPRYKQSAMRYIFRKDKKTGEAYGFLMAFVPNLAYLEATNFKPFRKMAYLERERNLGGFVFYYSLNGDFINGWSYENGEVVASIQPEADSGQADEVTDGKRLKAGGCDTYFVYEISEICDTNAWMVSVGGMEFFHSEMDCFTTSELYGSYTHCSGPGDGFVIPPPGGGSSSGGATTPTDKAPEKRTDCSGSAATNATNAKNAMTGNSDIINKMNTLRDYAKNQSIEYGTLIDSRGGIYQAGAIIKGEDGFINFQYSPYTVYDVHTHDKTSGFSGHAGYTGFSVEDIYTTMEANKFYYNYYNGSASNPYKGSIVIAYDGSEYILSVNDAKKAKDFLVNNPKKFEANDESLFKDSGMSSTYQEIKNNLSTIGYSQQDAHDYALTYLLDKYDTGLKISKKESGKTAFKEMKTEKTSNNYQPKICP